jgi:eukaryotic-like serine/threonine-protein kinase
VAEILPPRYENARQIGRGGMGAIYLAEDRDLGRQVAVKLLDDRFAGDEQLRLRFKREALTSARLGGNARVVTIFDVGEWEGRPYIVMEYLPGGTLADRAREGPVDHGTALAWLAQAAEALDAAHGHGIVHRDVKPANLLFDARGDLAVGDFGIARAADDTMGMTAAGTVLGTAGYLSPEQAMGRPATPASDLYALAIVAYELLTGRRPFARSSTTAEAAAHIHEPVPPASQRGVGLSPAVDRVFDRALAKDPADRYRSGGQFVDALRGTLAGGETATRVLPAAVPPPTRRMPPPRRRAPWVVPLVVAALLAAIAAGVLAAVLSTQDEQPRQGNQNPGPVTVTTQETLGTTTIVETITTTPATTTTTDVSIEDAVQLTDEATALLQQEQWEEALRTQRRALPALRDTYTDDFRYEAYAAYNMGKALAELGRCPRALKFLDRSDDLQGQRQEIDEARATCEDED